MLITEGEFDALVIKQVADDLVAPVSIGSAANRRINPLWYSKFLAAPTILVRMDADQAGQGASEQIAKLSYATHRIQVPITKDINDFYLQQGAQAVHNWIEQELNHA